MPGKRPLSHIILRYHLWAGALTLGVMMLLLLAMMDDIAQRLACYDLAVELRATSSYSTSATPLTHHSTRHLRIHPQQIALNAQGDWSQPELTTAPNGRPHTRLIVHSWSEADNVRAAGELHGTGHLPWVGGQVVWSARSIVTPDGPRILVAWEQLSAIRMATALTYGAVILATLFAFIISMLLALRISRYTTSVVRRVAQSGREMAAGNYQIHLPAQPVQELDELSSVITDLAHDLDQTTVDLRHEHQRLTRLEVLQRQFVADASHELRSPLAAMSMTLAAWDDGLLSETEQPEALARLRREAKRLGALVTQLLDLSRIESGREHLSPAPVDASAVITEVAEDFSSLPGATISVSLPDEPVTVSADFNALYRILHNLIGNARRFTDPSGSIHLLVVIEDSMVRFSVNDSGCGIPAEELPFIWDRFARSERVRASGEIGSGLGLAIVKALVDAMDGQVHAESTVGIGTTISFTLPLSTETELCQA